MRRADQIFRGFGKGAVFGVAVCLLTLAPGEGTAGSEERDAILATVRAYVTAVYARDYAEAYRWIAAVDRRVKSQADYTQDNEPFTGASLVLARRLAREIVIRDPVVERLGHRARVRAKVSLPNANSEEVSRLLLAKGGTAEAPVDELPDRLAKLEALIASGGAPRVEGEEAWALVQDAGRWHISLDWASGVRIGFATRVPEGLNVTATLDRGEVLTPRGEAVRLRLTVRNRGPAPVRLRAVHRVEPAVNAPKVDLVQCGFLFPAAIAKDSVDESPVVYFVGGDLSTHVKRLRVTLELQRAE